MDFVIDIYELTLENGDPGLMFRLIPVGTTYMPFSRKPDATVRGNCKPGHRLVLDAPVRTWFFNLKTKQYE